MSQTSTSWMRKRAKEMRAEMTPHEQIMWRLLRDGELGALNWRKQVALGAYIADFASHAAHLIVEVDGAQHGAASHVENDRERTEWFISQGYRVLRFWNFETKKAQNELWLSVQAAALQTPAAARMQRWRTANREKARSANTRLPLDGGGGREAAGGGEATAVEDDASRGSTIKDGGPHPLSHRAARADSSPIEGEQE